MKIKPISVQRQILPGTGSQASFILADARKGMQGLSSCADLIYMDPPFLTGRDFGAYDDRFAKEAYYSLMQEVLAQAYSSLKPHGNLFLHIDFRTSARLRLMLDELFGEEGFRNEIVWAYQSGGRATRHFSRKHDTILFYAKSKQNYFDAMQDALPRTQTRQNHMRRQVDENGRGFTSIRSNGKTYVYYDDAPVAASDVWSDISHLQQKDPERTGYPTQKPIRLLQRIIKCASREGDTVLDCFSGSGTTVHAAKALGRNAIGIDQGYQALTTLRKRMLGLGLEIQAEQLPPLQGHVSLGKGGPLVGGAAPVFCSFGEVQNGAYIHRRIYDGTTPPTPQTGETVMLLQTNEGEGVFLLEP